MRYVNMIMVLLLISGCQAGARNESTANQAACVSQTPASVWDALAEQAVIGGGSNPQAGHTGQENAVCLEKIERVSAGSRRTTIQSERFEANVEHLTNWAGNYTYRAAELLVPEKLEQVQDMVSRCHAIKVLGTRHSFNEIADTTGSLLSLGKLNRVMALDQTSRRVTVEAGIRYGELCAYLHANGYALHNLASLPHITVAGACATATHGSGDRNGSLATAVHSLEVVTANGEAVVFTRDQADGCFDGAVVGLGGLGVVTTITLDVLPTYQMRQYVYENLPLENLQSHWEAVFASAYSVSLFTDWKEASFNQVWLKQRLGDQGFDLGRATLQEEAELFGAKRANAHLHPVPGHTAVNCSEQLGIPGPWHERLPHFRMDFTPSAGDELQSEYFVPRRYAYEALCAIGQLREQISPLLHVSEVRTIAEDKLWMSPCYKQDAVAFHFTWKANWEAVSRLLPRLEEQLAPFQVRPHWGKLFTLAPALVQARYEKLTDFRRLLAQHDPTGKFHNDFLRTYILA